MITDWPIVTKEAVKLDRISVKFYGAKLDPRTMNAMSVTRKALDMVTVAITIIRKSLKSVKTGKISIIKNSQNIHNNKKI